MILEWDEIFKSVISEVENGITIHRALLKVSKLKKQNIHGSNFYKNITQEQKQILKKIKSTITIGAGYGRRDYKNIFDKEIGIFEPI